MKNEIILIIGASSDIGQELIALLKKRDQKSIIIAHYHSKKPSYQGVIPLHCDLSNQVAIEQFCQEVLEIGLPNKIVFLASPKVKNIRFKDLELKELQYYLSVGLFSTFLLLQKFLPLLAKQKECSKKIVYMLSSYTLGMPPMAMSAYVSMKYAVLGLMKSLVSEYRRYNIQINSVSPSMVETRFLEEIDHRIVELNAQNHPLKRNAKPSDIAPLIAMLLSQESDYLNGINLPITGGENF